MAAEMSATVAWASRHELLLEYNPERLTLWLALTADGTAERSAPERYLLRGRFDGYRGVPPEWTFVHPDTREEIGAAAFPHPDPLRPPPLGPSLFIDGSNG